jgi:Protein of unknown function (DUF3298)
MRTRSLTAVALIGAVTGLSGLPAAAAAGQAACDQLGGTVQSGNLCHVHTETSAYIIDLRWNIDYPDDQPVTDYLIRSRDNVVNATQGPGPKYLPYQMVLTSETFRSGQPARTIPEYGQPWHGTQSLVLLNIESLGDDKAGGRYKSFTFDFDKNRPVTFDNLFVPGTNPMDSIYPAVAAELQRQFVSRHFQLSPSVGRDPAHYQKFAITDQTVIFYFDVGELLVPEAGYFFAPVSRANLPPLQI